MTNGKIMAKDCVTVANFDLGGMAGHKKGQALVEVTFEVDTDGCLNVKATDKKATGNAQNVQIQDAVKFSDDDLARMHANIGGAK